MKVVILAGGFGTRISEESDHKPKPMIEIGGRPILWHLMKNYSAHGLNEFVICLGYKSYCIKEYFSNYYLHNSDVTFDLANNSMEVHRSDSDDWKVTLVETGLHTMTGGRLKRIRDYIDGTFCMTYGDGISDVDITKSIEFHRASGRLATMTAVNPPGRFGLPVIDLDQVSDFEEKPQGGETWINGGFFVLEPEVLDLVAGDETMWEREPMEQLAQQGQLGAFKHKGFWHMMDTQRDRKHLEALWASTPPWKTWG